MWPEPCARCPSSALLGLGAGGAHAWRELGAEDDAMARPVLDVHLMSVVLAETEDDVVLPGAVHQALAEEPVDELHGVAVALGGLVGRSADSLVRIRDTEGPGVLVRLADLDVVAEGAHGRIAPCVGLESVVERINLLYHSF